MAEPEAHSTEEALKLLESENFERADEEYRQAQKAGLPISSADYLNWGYTLARLRNDRGAIEKYQEAIKINPDYAQVHLNWGNSLGRLKDDLGAIEQYRKVAACPSSGVDTDQIKAQAHNYWGLALVRLKQPAEALEQYRLATDINSKYQEAWNNWANLLSNQGDFEGASQKYEQAASGTPKDSDYRGNWATALNSCAETLLAAGKPSEAWPKFVEAMTQNVSFVNYAKWVKALEQLDDDHRRSAEGEADKAILEASKSPDANKSHPAGVYNRWGEALAARFKFKDAMRQYGKAEKYLSETSANLIWRRDLANALMDQGWVLLSQFKRPEAVARFTQATKIAPDYPQAWTTLAGGLADDKQYELALRACEQSAAVDADKSWNYYVLWIWGNILIACGRRQDGLRKYSEGAREAKQVPFPYTLHNVADEHWKEGRYGKSRSEYKSALELYAAAKENYRNDENADFFGYYGNVLSKIFEWFDEAERMFKEGLLLNPNHPDILIGLTNLHLARRTKEPGNTSAYWQAQEHYVKATNALKGWRDQDPSSAGSRDWLTELKLGQLDLAFEFYDQAEEHLLSACTQNPDATEPHSELGKLYFMREDFDKAERCFLDARRRDPDSLSIRSSLAEVYRKANKLTNALDEHSRVLELAPTNLDSLIGQAQVYAALSEQGDDDMFGEAIPQFDLALSTGKRVDESSRALGKKEEATLYYLRGYARVQRYPNAKAWDQRILLRMALDDFETAGKLDPGLYKARLAAQKVKARLKESAPQRILEQGGSWIVVGAGFIVLMLAQLSFYFGAFGHPVKDLGSYSALTFGAITVMIAGLSLPRLTAFKVPGIEIEKVVDQIAVSSPLKISR